ncbi:MAG: PucR family transcriptional regulator, partial [Bacillota bacterium]
QARNKPQNKIEQYSEIALEHAKTVLKLNIQKKISNHQIESRYRDEFVQDLIFNNINSLQEVIERAKLYQWSFKEQMMAVVVDIDNFKEQYLKNQFTNSTQTLNDIRHQIFLKSKKLIKEYFSQVIYTNFSDNIVFIIQSNQSPAELNSLVEEVATKIRKVVKEEVRFSVTIGLGRIKSSVLELHASYQEAKEAVKLGRIIYQDNQTISYNSLGAYKLLAPIYRSENAEEFADTYLGNLIEYDREHNTELLEVLTTLVNNDWNLKATSEDLFIHYNTMKYKFKQLSEILNLDLKDSEQKLNVALSLKILQMAD